MCPADMLSLAVSIAIQIIVSLFLLAWTKKKVHKELDSGSTLAKVRSEMGALMAEMEGSADRNITILEDRLASLRELLAQADKRISLSAREDSRRNAEGKVRTALERDGYAPVLPEVQPQAAQTKVEPTEAVAPPKVAPPLAAKSPDIPFIRFSEKPVSIEAPFAQKALELSKRGFSSDIIAARLNSTLSEVELALAMGLARDKSKPQDDSGGLSF